jgi:hypothetical protein
LGLDRLMLWVALAVVLVAAGCGHGGPARPARLLDGRVALHFDPVRGSVVAAGRVLTRSELGRRLDGCLFPGDRASVAPDSPVVERVGVDGESLTVENRDGTNVYACDGGVDASGERAPPWCHTVSGELDHGRLLDRRLDVLCRDRRRRPLAYVFVDPVAAARWIGVREAGYVELYEVLAGLPVRVASTRAVDPANARATFEIAQYDAEGRELVHGELEAAVAG